MERNKSIRAIARVRGDSSHPQLSGIVRFIQANSGVMVEAEIFGLPESEGGFFGFHIHEGGRCTGDGFSDTGNHLNPDLTRHPQHMGDLPPLLGNHGRAYMKVFTERFSVKDVIGKTVVIHSEADDFRTDPSGNAGIKIGCGVIKKSKE